MSSRPANDASYRLIRDVEFGQDVQVYSFVNLYGCRIGDRSRIGTFVEIQSGVSVGADCKLQSHSFLCSGVGLGDGVFVGHGVMFINDKRPRATSPDGALQTEDDWEMLETRVEDGCSLGTGAVILGGVHIGSEATIGAGAVVTADVEPGATVAGVPARVVGEMRQGERDLAH